MDNARTDAAAADAALREALLHSRQRWRDFATLATDLAFETDAEGTLTFLAPEVALGWPAGELLGKPARGLLLRPEPDPFALRSAARGIRAWLRHGESGAACLCFSVAPLTDPAGGFAGLRGCGRDITAEMQEAEAQAAELRRATAVETLIRRVRREVLAPRMLATALESLPAAIGCAGGAVVEVAPGGSLHVLARHGGDPAPVIGTARPYFSLGKPVFVAGPRGEPMALIPNLLRRPVRHGLVVWRDPGARGFDADDRHLLGSLADLLFVAITNQAVQDELEAQARTDALTGLLNRRAFLADLRRCLDREATGGTRGGALLFLDLDNFKPINDILGHEAGDAALVAVAGLLRERVRATDLCARLGGDEFALWLPDADAAAAEARAQAICDAMATAVPPALLAAGPLTASIGAALRRPGLEDTPEALLARADAAMYAAKRAGRNRWQLRDAA